MLATATAHAETVEARSRSERMAIAAPAVRPAYPTATAGTPESTATPRNSNRLIGAVRVDLGHGSDRFTNSDFIVASAPFLGRVLDGDDMQDLMHAVAGVARSRGYILAHAVIPSQSLATGVISVKLSLGGIDRVELAGDDAPAVRARLEQLIGAPLTRTALQRQIALARDLPGVSIDRLAIAEQGNQTVLSARVRYKHGTVRGGIDNWGSDAVGPVRTRLAYDFNGLLGMERLSGTIEGVAAAQPSEMAGGSIRLAYDLDDHGTRFETTAVYSHSQPGASLASYALSGDYTAFGLEVSRPLLRGFTRSIWIAGGLRMITLDRWQNGLQTRHDRALIANIGLNGTSTFAGGRLRGGIGVSQLLDALGATDRANPLATRPGSGAGATFASFWLDWQGKISGPLSAWLALNGQIASAALPVTAQIAVGGPMFGRAFEFGERTGDSGLTGMAELRYTLRDRSFGLLRHAQLYGFADLGAVSNLDNEIGTGTLASAGGGARLSLTEHWRLGVEAALPVNQARYATGDMSARYRANLGFSF